MANATQSHMLRVKYIVFAAIAAMMAYVIYHNERFLIDPTNLIWQHYGSLGWWLLAHGLAGGCALILVPWQFSDRLRSRYAKVHRVVGRVSVAGALVLAPLGAYTQYLDERLGIFPRSFTIETVIQALLLMTTRAIGLYFATVRMIPQHRQWMTRTYGAALTFFEIRFILGITGWDQPPADPAVVQTVVWCCTAGAILVGDIATRSTSFNRCGLGS